MILALNTSFMRKTTACQLPGTQVSELHVEVIALLDGDDIFHREKLQLHVAFLEKYPQVGVTYNSRFEFIHSFRIIRRAVASASHRHSCKSGA